MFRTVSLMLVTLALAACGGSDNNAFEPPASGSGGTTTAPVSSVTVSSSTATIPGDGSSTSTITALVKDANNNAISGASVGFASDKGSLVVASTTTDSSGTATATLSGSGVTNGTAIKVTATAGTVSGSTTVTVANIQQTITVATSTPQIASDGSTSATITATVLNSGNQVVSGIPVTITSTSGALTVTRGTTDASGTAVATLNSGPDPTNRTITITAANGGSTATVPVDVAGSKLVFSGQPSLVQGTQSVYTATLTNSGSVAIAGRPVTFSSSNGNTLSTTSATTNSSGQASVSLTATNSGNDTLTATALGLSASQPVSVSNQNFAITVPAANTNIGLGATQTVTVTWLSSGVPQAGQTINLSATRGQFSAPSPNLWTATPNSSNPSSATAVTDANGNATILISSANSGPSVISASATNVSAQTTVDFIATNPTAIVVQASPATIPTQGQSTISAIVRDAANNLVEGQTVLFTAVDNTGGNLTVASAVTDTQGQAQTLYNASSTPSSSGGVQITATVQNTAVHATATLTVGGQSLFITLGTGAVLDEEPTGLPTRFVLPYSVSVVDSSGNPVANRGITLSLHSLQYRKGTWANPGAWTQVINATCPNEDANHNGILEPNLGEDVSGQGNNNTRLDPGDIALTSLATVTTGPNGTADFKVVYPEDHALWVQVALTASSQASGSESSTTATFWLPILADYLTKTSSPPGMPSPYGVAANCTSPN